MTVVTRARVGEVLRLERREVAIEPESEYQLIGVYSFGKGIFHRDPKPGLELGDYRYFRVEPGDLVLSNIQAWEGAIARATAQDAGTIGTHRFLSYMPRDADQIDTNWARWFFLSEAGMTLIRRAAPGTAVRNRTLAVKRFEDLVIPLPRIDEQRRVAARIDRAVLLAAEVASRVELVGELAWATQVALASGAGHDDEQRAVTPLSEVLSQSDAHVAVDPAEDYRVAGIYSFGRGLIDRGVISGSETSYKTLTRLEEGNIVVSKLNGWEGAVAVVGPEFHGTHVSGEYPTFTVDESRLLPAFFRGIAKSATFWDRLNQSVRGSMVRRRRISASDFLRATIWLPSLEDQARIASRIDRLDAAIALSQRSLSRATAIRDAILNHEFGSA